MGGQHSKAEGALKEVLEMRPWLKDYLPGGKEAGASSSSHAELPIADPEPMDAARAAPPTGDALDLDLEAIYEEVMAKRAIYDVTGAAADSSFKVTARGGLSTFKAKGAAVDAISAQCDRGTQAATWCATYNLNRQASYSTLKYGDHGASLMANAWMNKMQALYQVWLDAGEPGAFDYTAEHMAMCQEDPAFGAWVASLAPGNAALVRVEQLRAIWPRR